MGINSEPTEHELFNCEVIHGGIFEMIQWMESRAMSSRPIGHAFMHFNINTSESAAIYINIVMTLCDLATVHCPSAT